jgi:hypothetical protein
MAHEGGIWICKPIDGTHLVQMMVDEFMWRKAIAPNEILLIYDT